MRSMEYQACKSLIYTVEYYIIYYSKLYLYTVVFFNVTLVKCTTLFFSLSVNYSYGIH